MGWSEYRIWRFQKERSGDVRILAGTNGPDIGMSTKLGENVRRVQVP